VVSRVISLFRAFLATFRSSSFLYFQGRPLPGFLCFAGGPSSPESSSLKKIRVIDLIVIVFSERVFGAEFIFDGVLRKEKFRLFIAAKIKNKLNDPFDSFIHERAKKGEECTGH